MSVSFLFPSSFPKIFTNDLALTHFLPALYYSDAFLLWQLYLNLLRTSPCAITLSNYYQMIYMIPLLDYDSEHSPFFTKVTAVDCPSTYLLSRFETLDSSFNSSMLSLIQPLFFKKSNLCM